MTIARPRALLVIVVASLALAACGTTTPSTSLAGVPSASIEVPLTNVGCTSTDTCLALGTSNAASGPTALGEDRGTHGSWHTLSLPSAPSSRLDTLACARTSCLAGGAQPSGDLLWRYQVGTRAVSALTPPPGGQDVRALTCVSDASCALIDVTSVVGAARLAWTLDAGTTWTTPTAIPWSVNTTVTGIACSSESTCLVAATTGNHVRLEETTDAGATWTPLTVSGQWRVLRDLRCSSSQCTALAAGESNALVRTRNFATSWTSLTLAPGTHAVACTRLVRCVAVGQSTSGAGTITTITERHLHHEALLYAPTPLFAAACGARVCVAIGASTLVATAP